MILDTNQSSLKESRTPLLTELEALGVRFKGNSCKCPFHDDQTPSACVYQGKHGWRFKCFTCGFNYDIFDLRAHINKTTAVDELKKTAGPTWKPEKLPEVYPTLEAITSQFRNVEGVFKYINPTNGRPELVVIRWHDGTRKRFIQVSPTPGGYWMRKPEHDCPIYNRTRILESDTVVVVEGEKCVHALHNIGIVATTRAGGACGAADVDWTPLAGKTCILWPDADDPTDEHPEGKGVWHMREVQRHLSGLNPPPKLYWVDPAALELSGGEDVADLIERYKKLHKPAEITALVEEILADADSVGVMSEYRGEIEATIAGQRRVIPFPWPLLSQMSRALMRGKVTCICGDGGSGKSILMSQCMVDWAQFGVKAAVYHLEDERAYHMQRMHAQLANCSDITSHEWVEQHADWMRASMDVYEGQLTELGQRIYEAPDDQVSLDMLAKWLEERAKAGFEVAIIDPVTAAESESRPWIADLKFITKCKVIARRYGIRVILVTHPRTGAKSGKSNHNDMAGGAAYPRFAHTVLWLERNDAEAEFPVLANGKFTEYVQPNRLLYIAKARNGPGAGRKIAFNFDAKSLTYQEIGPVVKAQT